MRGESAQPAEPPPDAKAVEARRAGNPPGLEPGNPARPRVRKPRPAPRRGNSAWPRVGKLRPAPRRGNPPGPASGNPTRPRVGKARVRKPRSASRRGDSAWLRVRIPRPASRRGDPAQPHAGKPCPAPRWETPPCPTPRRPRPAPRLDVRAGQHRQNGGDPARPRVWMSAPGNAVKTGEPPPGPAFGCPRRAAPSERGKPRPPPR